MLRSRHLSISSFTTQASCLMRALNQTRIRFRNGDREPNRKKDVA
jgi:hypothetical protein